jgi:hypothetical protein
MARAFRRRRRLARRALNGGLDRLASTFRVDADAEPVVAGRFDQRVGCLGELQPAPRLNPHRRRGTTNAYTLERATSSVTVSSGKTARTSSAPPKAATY